MNEFHTLRRSLRSRSARFLLLFLTLAQLVGPLSVYAAEITPPLPPAAVKHLYRLHRDRARVSTGAQELSFELRLSLQSGISKVEREWTDGALLGLPGTLEITQGVIQEGYSETKPIPQKPVAAPAMRAAEAAAWEFARRFVPAAQLETVVACLDNGNTSEDEKLHCALAVLPQLAAETPFTSLTVSEQVVTLKTAIGLRPQSPPTTDELSQLTSEQFWAVGVGLFKAWKRVAESEKAVLKEFKEDAQKLQTKLEATLSDFSKRAHALEADAKRIADLDLDLDPKSPRYQKYIKDAQELLYEQLALESMTSGMVPAAVIDLANAPKDLQEFAHQLTASSENVSRILEGAARGALGDLVPSVDALPEAALSALGLPKELGAVADIINGDDPAQLLTGPVLEAVGLPPELGGIAVAIGTGNFVGAVASFTDMAGFSLGGLVGGGSGAEMAEVRKELGEIREQLRAISAKLDQIDRKIDELRELVIAQHAEVMAKLNVLGEVLDAIREANEDALRRIIKNCDVLVDRVEETKRLSKRRGNYSQLASVLTNEEIGPFERCWTTIQDTASQRSSNSVFTLGLNEGALNARDRYRKDFLAPHTHFFREAFDSQRELQRATLLLGTGENSLRSATRRRELIQSTDTLDRRRLFAAEVLDPKKILDYEAVRQFTADALLAVSLRPFINLQKKWMVSLDCALGRRGCLDKTADDNYIQIMSVLRGCLRLAETGAAQAAVLDGDLVLPFAIDVIQDPGHDEYNALVELMEKNEIFAANVAIAVLRSALAPVAAASAEVPFSSSSAQVDSHPIQVLGSLYSFAVETNSPAMMERLINGSSPEWDGLSFFVRDGNINPTSCTHTHQGLGLYMRLPNGICLQMPSVKEVQMGILRESPGSHAFRDLRRSIMEEIVGYEFRKSAPAPARDWIDSIEVGRLN